MENVSKKQTVSIAEANGKEKYIVVEELNNWTPKNINYFGDSVYFKNENTYYSMKRIDFDKVFKK